MTDDRPIDLLLVEDNPGDVRLTIEALKETGVECKLNVARDGVEALDYLFRRGRFPDATRPNVILLDLNLPRKDGRSVLAEIKSDENLRRIPVIVLTTSRAEEDILKAYDLHANCFVAKPVDMLQFIDVVRAIDAFWFRVALLPEK